MTKIHPTASDVHAAKLDTDRPFPSHRACSVHAEQQTDERRTRIDKKHMEIDQNDRDPPNSISILSKAIDDVHSFESDPDRPFPSHRTCSVHTEQQTDERSTRIDKKHLEIDQNDRDPPNSISKLYLSRVLREVTIT